MMSLSRWASSLFNVGYVFAATAFSQAMGSPLSTSYLLTCAGIAFGASIVVFLVALRKDPSA